MTVKLVVLYARPDDVDAFEEHYLGVHVPLVDKVPGLLRFEGARVRSAADGGDQELHRVAEMWFEDLDSLKAGLASEEGRATGADYQQIAPAGSRMYVATVDE